MADAMRYVLRRRSDIKILCVGNVVVPQHFEALRSYLREQGLAGHILLPGYYENVEDPLRIADAFLLPSFIEGWSIAMNEAMFYGKPMILSDIGGAAEVIDNSDTGLLLPTEYEDFTKLDFANARCAHLYPAPLPDGACAGRSDDEFCRRPVPLERSGTARAGKDLSDYDFPMIVRNTRDVIAEVVAGGIGKPRMSTASAQ